MILAGGEGKRLHPLTSVRTKPAVPFGGNYRIIDFALSNFINSGFLKIFVLIQFKSHSLMQHLREGWRLSGLRRHFINPIPAHMRMGKRWYEGTADALKKIGKSGEEKFYFKQGYDNRLAHLIEAGCDLYLMPSQYEPCGLNQIYSLR